VADLLAVTDVSVTWTGSWCFRAVTVDSQKVVRVRFLQWMRDLDRRWQVAIGIAVVAVVAVVVSETMFGRPSEECRPVIDLLNYNSSQAKLIEAKSGDATAIPNVAEEAAYQKWADGLAQRAQNVSAPDLAQPSIELATLASQFVTKLSRLRIEATTAPGAPAPPVAYEMAALNIQITDHLSQLSKACPR
jgi:hypothetical protein